MQTLKKTQLPILSKKNPPHIKIPKDAHQGHLPFKPIPLFSS